MPTGRKLESEPVFAHRTCWSLMRTGSRSSAANTATSCAGRSSGRPPKASRFTTRPFVIKAVACARAGSVAVDSLSVCFRMLPRCDGRTDGGIHLPRKNHPTQDTGGPTETPGVHGFFLWDALLSCAAWRRTTAIERGIDRCPPLSGFFHPVPSWFRWIFPGRNNCWRMETACRRSSCGSMAWRAWIECGCPSGRGSLADDKSRDGIRCCGWVGIGRGPAARPAAWAWFSHRWWCRDSSGAGFVRFAGCGSARFVPSLVGEPSCRRGLFCWSATSHQRLVGSAGVG